MKGKHMQILIAVLLILLMGGWQFYSRKKTARQETVARSSFIPVNATIKSVFPSGKGFHRSTLLTVNYTYQDSAYVQTVKMGGYVEGRFNRGDTLTLYLNPERPEEIVNTISPDF